MEENCGDETISFENDCGRDGGKLEMEIVNEDGDENDLPEMNIDPGDENDLPEMYTDLGYEMIYQRWRMIQDMRMIQEIRMICQR